MSSYSQACEAEMSWSRGSCLKYRAQFYLQFSSDCSGFSHLYVDIAYRKKDKVIFGKKNVRNQRDFCGYVCNQKELRKQTKNVLNPQPIPHFASVQS